MKQVALPPVIIIIEIMGTLSVNNFEMQNNYLYPTELWNSLCLSVRVIHDVILAIPNNASSEQLYMDDFKAVKKAVDELVDCTGGKTKLNEWKWIYN